MYIGEVSEGVSPLSRQYRAAYAKPAVSRGLYSQRCYLPMLPFTQHELFQPRFLRGCTTIKQKRTTAIPKSTLPGIAVFCVCFSYQYPFQIISGAYAPQRNWFQREFCIVKSIIFESMTNRRICGTIKVPENNLDICAYNAFKSILILIFCKQ